MAILFPRMFYFLFNISLCVFLFEFPFVYTFLLHTSVQYFVRFFLCLHACILQWFCNFSSSPMTFKSFTFHFYICIHFYLSPFILHLVGFGSYWMCSFLQHSGFSWYNSYTPPFSLELACISSCLSFCPSLCEYFQTPSQIWLSHVIISFHTLSLTMILSSWSLRGSYFAFVCTYLMLKTKFTSSHGFLGPSHFLVATCVCKTK